MDGLGIDGINHLTLSVPDVERAVGFYTDVLGCRVVARWPDGAYVLAGRQWVALVRGEPSPRGDGDYSHVAFGVSHRRRFDELATRIRSSGAVIWKDNRSEGESLYFRDPAGHHLEVHATGLAARVADARERPWPGLELSEDAEVAAVMSALPEARDATDRRVFTCFPAAVVVFVVDAEDRFLVLDHPSVPGWQVVNGAVDAGESLVESAQREVREEAGPEVEVRVIGCFDAQLVRYDERVPALLSLSFVAEYLGGTVEPGDDMAGATLRWATTDELASGALELFLPNDAGAFRRALEARRSRLD